MATATTAANESAAYELGLNCGGQGDPAAGNPYRPGSKLYTAWQTGWDDAQRSGGSCDFVREALGDTSFASAD